MTLLTSRSSGMPTATPKAPERYRKAKRSLPEVARGESRNGSNIPALPAGAASHLPVTGILAVARKTVSRTYRWLMGPPESDRDRFRRAADEARFQKYSGLTAGWYRTSY